MNKNTELNTAKAAKKDEFYTQLSDIEEELKHYTEHFRGKVVYSNCDDWRKSQFVKYFKDHFHEMGLKRYIATCYAPKDVFEHGEALWYEFDGVEERHGVCRCEGQRRMRNKCSRKNYQRRKTLLRAMEMRVWLSYRRSTLSVRRKLLFGRGWNTIFRRNPRNHTDREH